MDIEESDVESRYRRSPIPHSGEAEGVIVVAGASLDLTVPTHGRICGRLGTPPDHLLGVRPREQRLAKHVLAEAQQRADAIFESMSKTGNNSVVDPDEWFRDLTPAAREKVIKFARQYS